VVLFDAAARSRLSEGPLAVKEGDVQSVAFSPDGKTIAAGYGGGGGGVVLFDAAARSRLSEGPLAVKKGDVPSVAFSPDGKTIAAGYDVGPVVQWDVDLRSWKRLAGRVGGVVQWDVDLRSWKRLAGRIANRNFTRAEWRQYFPEETYRATFPDLPVPPEDAASASAR
jgi:WD40 repeat protein